VALRLNAVDHMRHVRTYDTPAASARRRADPALRAGEGLDLVERGAESVAFDFEVVPGLQVDPEPSDVPK
jgi:hypothetical protein